MFAFTKLMQAMVASGSVSDPQFYLTTLLLNTSSTNGAQNNTFLDSSTNNFTITRNGNTTQGTFTPFSQTGWSNYFGGSDYLSISSATALQLTTASAFTIEAWINPNSTLVSAGAKGIVGKRNTGTEYQFFVASDGTLSVYNGTTSYSGGTAVTAVGSWVHVAVTWDLTTLRFFINGTVCATTFTSFSLGTASTNAVTIACDSPGAELFPGYISNLRITKGGALYTSSFTPSTTPLTTTVSAGTVSLLTCQSNRFLDNSTNAFAITTVGTPSVQAFSPFAPTAAYDTAVVGGSAYFDGSGDYLSLASATALQLGSSDFTLETWIYTTSTTNQVFLANEAIGALGFQFAVETDQSVSMAISSNGTSYAVTPATTTKLKLGQWNHLAVLRSGSGTGNITFYVNGVKDATTATFSGTVNSTASTFNLGCRYSSGVTQPLNGYMGGFRLIKGQALYTTSTITIPTGPFTTTGYGTTSQSITGAVNLLTNFTNTGIYDSTAKNVLETVGNAQVSTTQAKWGTTSMYFDGTGDVLTIRNNYNLFNQSGNFTIEAWVYFSAVGSNQQIFGCNSTSGALQLQISSGNKFIVDRAFTGTVITGTTTVATGTWYHVAMVKNSGSTTLYVNGVAEGTPYSYSGTALANTVCVGGNFDGSTAYLNGYIDDLRVTNYARYTTTFTPPTAAFPLQ